MAKKFLDIRILTVDRFEGVFYSGTHFIERVFSSRSFRKIFHYFQVTKTSRKVKSMHWRSTPLVPHNDNAIVEVRLLCIAFGAAQLDSMHRASPLLRSFLLSVLCFYPTFSKSHTLVNTKSVKQENWTYIVFGGQFFFLDSFLTVYFGWPR